MKTKYYMARDIVRHVDALAGLFPAIADDRAAAWDRLQQLERQGQTLAVQLCNGWIEQDEYEKRSASLLARVDKLTGYKAAGVPVFHNGDPRGYALKINWETREQRAPEVHTDWGGYGILAPDFGGRA